MNRFSNLLTAVFVAMICLFSLSGFARESVAYQYMLVSRFPRVQAVIPRSTTEDRFYVQSRFKNRVIKAQALIDNQKLVPALGNQRHVSLPEELIQGYQKTVTEVDAFPIQPFSQAQSQIRFSFYLENSQEKIYTLQGKALQKFKSHVLHQGVKP